MMGNSMGAGDAFLAGLIAYLCSYPIPNSQAELNCLVDWGNQAALAHIRGPVLGRPERVLTRGSGVV
jgi:sugar/nucleoside kinase (ribokinase family)